jgi:hypothetical protein
MRAYPSTTNVREPLKEDVGLGLVERLADLERKHGRADGCPGRDGETELLLVTSSGQLLATCWVTKQ